MKGDLGMRLILILSVHLEDILHFCATCIYLAYEDHLQHNGQCSLFSSMMATYDVKHWTHIRTLVIGFFLFLKRGATDFSSASWADRAQLHIDDLLLNLMPCFMQRLVRQRMGVAFIYYTTFCCWTVKDGCNLVCAFMKGKISSCRHAELKWVSGCCC